MNAVLILEGKHFENHLEEHHILSLFSSGNKVEDLCSKYKDLFPSFYLIITKIGTKYCSRDEETTIMNEIGQLYNNIC